MTRFLQALPHSSHWKEEMPEISTGLWMQADTSEEEMELSQYKQHAWKSPVPAPPPALQQDSHSLCFIFPPFSFPQGQLQIPGSYMSILSHPKFSSSCCRDEL